MAVLRDQPYSNFNFLIDIGTGDTSSFQAGFSEVIFPEASLDVIEYRTGNTRENHVIKLTGQERYTNLVLKRGVIGSLDLYQWWNQVRNGDQNATRTVTIQLLSEDRTNVVLTWKFLRARPVKYHFSELNGNGKEILVEYLELAFERMEME